MSEHVQMTLHDTWHQDIGSGSFRSCGVVAGDFVLYKVLSHPMNAQLDRDPGSFESFHVPRASPE